MQDQGKTPRAKKHRLALDRYVGKTFVSITICERHRRPLLASHQVVDPLVQILAEECEKQNCTVPIYTFMPDHIHLIVFGREDSSNTKQVVDRFKSRAGHLFIRRKLGAEFQRSYHDHIIRPEEGWQSRAKYIAANPCRAGLAEDVFDWPFTGSIGYDLKDVLLDAFW